MGTIELKLGDICQEATEAIVNAANNDLLHGGGVAAAIVQAGGKSIQEQSDKIAPIPLGEAAVTKGGKLKAKYVIHAASMRLGEVTSEEYLTKSIRNSFKRAIELGISSIAFPALGTGIGRFPIERCAEISLREAKNFLAKNPKFKKVVFVLHSNKNYQTFKSVKDKLDKL